MIEIITRDFNKEARTWDDNPMRVKIAGAISSAILNHITLTKNMEIMDYGAGTGLVTLALQQHVKSIQAVDSSQGMLDMLNKKINKAKMMNVSTTLLDLEKDPILDKYFDLIVSTMTMHHVGNVANLIMDFCKMLHPGGYLAIADLDLDNGEFHTDNTGVKHNGFDRNKIEQIFAQNGLTQITTVTVISFSKEVENKGNKDFSIFLTLGKSSN
jgi:ubiquinone/menaquinone biosynthesis C-methylase UbiE